MCYRHDPGSVREKQDERHSGVHVLWVISLLHNKEMNPACRAAADGNISSINLTPKKYLARQGEKDNLE